RRRAWLGKTRATDMVRGADARGVRPDVDRCAVVLDDAEVLGQVVRVVRGRAAVLLHYTHVVVVRRGGLGPARAAGALRLRRHRLHGVLAPGVDLFLVLN